jgi:hypothetical protein
MGKETVCRNRDSMAENPCPRTCVKVTLSRQARARWAPAGVIPR